MPVRPGRLLPSVVVGALVTGAVAWGAGTAVAEPTTCNSADGVTFVVSGTLDLLTDSCSLDSSVSASADELEAAGYQTLADYEAQLAEEAEQEGLLEEQQNREEEQREQEQRDSEQQARLQQLEQQARRQQLEQQRAQQEAAQREAALAAPRAPDVRATAPNVNLLSPGGASGGLAATTPALGFGTLDPSLLLAPAGSPLRTLTGLDEGSPVTTTSDVQAMAFDNLPGGLGTPAVTGVLILSTLAAFALRHRLLRRVRVAAAPDDFEIDTAEIPAREPAG